MISLFVSNSDSSNVTKNGSQIQLSLNPAIVLNPEKKWFCACSECDIVYCFPNILTNINDRFTYKIGSTTYTHKFSQGIYTLELIQNEINRFTQNDIQLTNIFILEADYSNSHVFVHFMTTTSSIDITGNDNVMKILGFVADAQTTQIGTVNHVNDYVEGTNNAQLNNIQNVLVLASFVNGSYYNAQAKNVLHSVTPDVKPYSTIMSRPQKCMYVPITQNILDTITFKLVSQDGDEINLGVNTVGGKYEKWSMRIVIIDESKVS